MKKEKLNKIFVIKDPAFVTLLIKMVSLFKNCKHNSFCIKKNGYKTVYPSEKDFAVAPEEEILMSFKKSFEYHSSTMNLNSQRQYKIKEREGIILKKLRVFKTESVYDSISFSQDYLKTISDLIICFDVVSQYKLFTEIAVQQYSKNNLKSNNRPLPFWFKETEGNSISKWIVAYFERRIIECYFENNMDYDTTNRLEIREDYKKIWEGLSESEQDQVIDKSINLIDGFKKISYSTEKISKKVSTTNKKLINNNPKNGITADQLNWNEVMLKVVWQLNANYKVVEKLKDIQALKEYIKNKIINTRKENASNFIGLCVGPNLSETLKIERLFMNLMLIFVHDLYIQKNINELNDEEFEDKESKKKKKKRKKRNKKNRKNKNQEESKDENVEIEKVDLKNKSLKLEENFLDKIKEKIRLEGDKQGLLIPLLNKDKLGEEGEAEIEIIKEELPVKEEVIKNATLKIKNILKNDDSINLKFSEIKSNKNEKNKSIENKETINSDKNINDNLINNSNKDISIKISAKELFDKKTNSSENEKNLILSNSKNQTVNETQNDKSNIKKIEVINEDDKLNRKSKSLLITEEIKKTSKNLSPKKEVKKEKVKEVKKTKKYTFKLKRSNKERKNKIQQKKESNTFVSNSKQNEVLERKQFTDKKSIIKNDKIDSIKDVKNKNSSKLESRKNQKEKNSQKSSTKIQKWQKSEDKTNSTKEAKINSIKTNTANSEIVKKKTKKKNTENLHKWNSKTKTIQKWDAEDSKPIKFTSVAKKNNQNNSNNFYYNNTKSFNENNGKNFLNNKSKFAFSEYNNKMNPVGFSNAYSNNFGFNMNEHNIHYQNNMFQNYIPNELGINLPYTNKNIYTNENNKIINSEILSGPSSPQKNIGKSANVSINAHIPNFPNKSESLQNIKSQSYHQKESKNELEINIENKIGNIKKLTREAFNDFTTDSIKNIINDLKSNAEELRPYREIILKRINDIVHRSFKTDKVNVVPYGSFETGLLTPYSDLDLAITFSSYTYYTNDEKNYFLETLENNLKLFSFVTKSSKILSATVPVIKLEADASIEYKNMPEKMEKSRIIKIDIIVGSNEKNGDLNTAFQTTNYIKGRLQIYPSLFDVALFFKYVMTTHGFADAFKGGINSYGFCVFLIAFLKFYSYDNSTDIGNIIYEFLYFFGFIFQPDTTCVDIKNSEIRQSTPFLAYPNYIRGSQLYILDPTSMTVKNITNTCFRIYPIKNYFAQCFSKLFEVQRFMECKLLKKFEETINKGVSVNNRFNFEEVKDNKTVPEFSNSALLQDNNFSNNNMLNYSLKLPQDEILDNPQPNIPKESNHIEVMSQDNHKQLMTKNININKETENDSVFVCRNPSKSVIVKPKLIPKIENKKEVITKIEEETRTLKKKVKDEKTQMENVDQFQIQKENLYKFFNQNYSELFEKIFSLNGKGIEQESHCESVVHDKLQQDLNFEGNVQENWETKSECGDIRKNKKPEVKIEKNQKNKKLQDDLSYNNIQPLVNENILTKSAEKNNNFFISQNLNTNSSSNRNIQPENNRNNRKFSIMSFGEEADNKETKKSSVISLNKLDS